MSEQVTCDFCQQDFRKGDSQVIAAGTLQIYKCPSCAKPTCTVQCRDCGKSGKSDRWVFSKKPYAISYICPWCTSRDVVETDSGTDNTEIEIECC